MRLLISLLICLYTTSTEKLYVKYYYGNGNIKEEGWIQDNTKIDYWYFYYENGNIKEEGRYEKNARHKYWKFYYADGTKQMEGWFKHGLANDWWIFYKDNMLQKKAAYNNGKQHGYTIYYINGNITKAEKYKDDVKIGEWTDIESFRRDN